MRWLGNSGNAGHAQYQYVITTEVRPTGPGQLETRDSRRPERPAARAARRASGHPDTRRSGG
jgi:hypothetical protein